MPKGAWGLDVSKSSLKAVRLQFIKGKVELTDIDVIEYSIAPGRDEHSLEQEIRGVLSTFTSRHKLRGDQIVASLPAHSAIARFIKLPPVSPGRLKEIIQFEAQQHIPFPLNEVVWRYQATKEKPSQPDEELDVGLFVIKKELVDQFLSLLTLAKINIDILQLNPIALYNFIMYDYDLGQSFIILDIGANNTDLIVVDEDTFWIRNIPIVGNDITKALQQKFDLAFPEAEQKKVNVGQGAEAGKIFNAIQPVLKDLVSEIHRSIGYYKSLSTLGKAINFDKIVLAGNASQTVFFEEFLAQRLQLQPIRVTRLNKIEPTARAIQARSPNGQQLLHTNMPSLGVALGLATQGLELTNNRINLLSQEAIKEKAISKKKPVIAAIAVVIALILMILHSASKKTYENLQALDQKAEETIEKAQKINREVNQAIQKISPIQQQLAAISYIEPDLNIWVKLLNALNKIPVMLENAPNFDKGFMESDVPKDDEILQHFEQNKIWLLSLNAEKKFVKGANRQTNPVVVLKIICGMIYHEKDGRPDPVGSQMFIKNKLVKPLAEEFKCEERAPKLIGTNRIVRELVTPNEEKKINIVDSINDPKYYRFEVNMEIPLINK